MENVLIVDDNPVARRTLELVLVRSGHRVVGRAGNGVEGVRLVGRTAPSLMLLDLDMPLQEGLTVLRKMRRDHPWLPVLVVSELDPRLYAVRCMRLGARGFLSKADGGHLLPRVLEQMPSGRMLFPADAERSASLMQFSDRELVVLRCWARGGDDCSVAAALMLSPSSSQSMCRRLQAKLELDSVGELREYGRALRLG